MKIYKQSTDSCRVQANCTIISVKTSASKTTTIGMVSYVTKDYLAIDWAWFMDDLKSKKIKLAK